ncbi:MAG: trp operon repressor [Puniceicoccales bacterium]|jgi:TrpR-related protein YerC/YecD|nr:trp operon repressor [Puniceicoccales bacterium]
MAKRQTTVKIADLCDALLALESREEAVNFIKDLCTPKEIAALSERWKICQLLAMGDMSYREINAATKASITTIGRVARFLKDEPYNGYGKILNKLKAKEI